MLEKHCCLVFERQVKELAIRAQMLGSGRIWSAMVCDALPWLHGRGTGEDLTAGEWGLLRCRGKFEVLAGFLAIFSEFS